MPAIFNYAIVIILIIIIIYDGKNASKLNLFFYLLLFKRTVKNLLNMNNLYTIFLNFIH